MDRSEILKILAEHRDELKNRFSVSSLSLFGSVARNQATPESDIDLLVSFEDIPGLLKFLELKTHLERICKCPVDLVTKDALKAQLRHQILKETVDAI